jgi:hypothetical protein
LSVRPTDAQPAPAEQQRVPRLQPVRLRHDAVHGDLTRQGRSPPLLELPWATEPARLEADEQCRFALVVKPQDRLRGDDRARLLDPRLTLKLAGQ